MPKGRGARNRGRHPGKKGERPKRKGDRLSGIVGLTQTTIGDLQRREDAAAAGGFTRGERRKSYQRETEAARVAARKLAKAVDRK